jgi:hypothetical protein
MQMTVGSARARVHLPPQPFRVTPQLIPLPRIYYIPASASCRAASAWPEGSPGASGSWWRGWRSPSTAALEGAVSHGRPSGGRGAGERADDGGVPLRFLPRRSRPSASRGWRTAACT